ncbi:WD40 repeat protein [Nocardioides albertanoniae]|uniref:WD40 repeat protein n=1 Tax=Nocardioides albertanoniae TaxID=1175486 RepID=A0A543A5D5_9ACTN|nr:PD40 domain-containing protein [Nocardioides albertanoniae]TQL67696.1 WD40 repeat protein [Nocardioides albertanoniae]
MKRTLPLSAMLLAGMLSGCAGGEDAACSSSATVRPSVAAPGAVFPDTLSVSPTGDAVAAGCWQGLCRWDAADRTYEVALDRDPLTLAADWSMVATGAGCGDIALVDLDSGDRIVTLAGLPYEDDVTDTAWIRDVAISPDGKLVAATGTADALMIWDSDGKEIVDTEAPSAGSLAFNHDGSRLAVTTRDGVEIIDAESGESSGRLAGAEGTPAWSPDGHWLAGPGVDGAPTLWSATDLSVVETLPGADADGFSFAQTSATVGYVTGETAEVWAPKKLDGDGSQRTLPGLVASGQSVEGPAMTAFSPDGSRLYAATDDEGIVTWDLAADRSATRFPLPPTSS